MPAEAKKLLAENHICTDFTYEISSKDCMKCEVNTSLRSSLPQQEKKNIDGYCPAAGTVTQNISSTFKGSHPPMLSRSNKVMEMNSKSLEAINGRSYHQNDPKAVTALNAASYVSSGYAQSKLGKYEEALDSFIESLKIYRSLKDENPKSRKSCLNLITSVFKQMDQDRKNIYCSKMSDEAKNLLADNHIYTDSIDEISSNYCMKGEVNIPLSSSRLQQEKNTRTDYYPAAGTVTDNISSTFPPLLGRGGVSMKMNSKSRELIDKNQILVDQPNHSMGASSEGFIFMGQSSNQNSGAVENNCDPEPEEILSGGCNVFYSYLS